MALVVGGASSAARNLRREVDPAVVAEARDRLAGPSVDGQQIPVWGSIEQPFVVPARPIRESARAVAGRVDGRLRRSDHVRVGEPPRGSSPGVERRRLSERRDDVDGAADHQRRDPEVEHAQVRMDRAERVEVEVGVGRSPAPGDLEIVEVRGVDLVEAGVFRPAEVAGVRRPLAVRCAVLSGDRLGE